jgi:hypothetical protein
LLLALPGHLKVRVADTTGMRRRMLPLLLHQILEFGNTVSGISTEDEPNNV